MPLKHELIGRNHFKLGQGIWFLLMLFDVIWLVKGFSELSTLEIGGWFQLGHRHLGGVHSARCGCSLLQCSSSANGTFFRHAPGYGCLVDYQRLSSLSILFHHVPSFYIILHHVPHVQMFFVWKLGISDRPCGTWLDLTHWPWLLGSRNSMEHQPCRGIVRV